MKIIDFHVHPYLSKQEYAGMYQESFFLEWEDGVKDIKRAGITQIAGSVIDNPAYSDVKDPSAIIKLNKKAVEIYKRFSDFYYPGFHINPNYVEESCETIEWMHKNGFRLIGELVPYMQGWSDYSNIKADFTVWK